MGDVSVYPEAAGDSTVLGACEGFNGAALGPKFGTAPYKRESFLLRGNLVRRFALLRLTEDRRDQKRAEELQP